MSTIVHIRVNLKPKTFQPSNNWIRTNSSFNIYHCTFVSSLVSIYSLVLSRTLSVFVSPLLLSHFFLSLYHSLYVSLTNQAFTLTHSHSFVCLSLYSLAHTRTLSLTHKHKHSLRLYSLYLPHCCVSIYSLAHTRTHSRLLSIHSLFESVCIWTSSKVFFSFNLQAVLGMKISFATVDNNGNDHH